MRRFLKALPSRHWRELGRLFRNHRWERNDDGDILISALAIQGRYKLTAPDGLGTTVESNLITIEGMNHLLAVAVGGAAQYTTWYLAPIGANVVPTDAWTYAATMGNGAAREDLVQYVSATRPVFTEKVPAGGSTDNNASPALLVAAQNNQTIYGGLVVSNSQKNDKTSGVLLSAALYSTPRVLPLAGDDFGMKYSLTLVNVE